MQLSGGALATYMQGPRFDPQHCKQTSRGVGEKDADLGGFGNKKRL